MTSDASLQVWAQKALEVCSSRKQQRRTGLHLLAHTGRGVFASPVWLQLQVMMGESAAVQVSKEPCCRRCTAGQAEQRES